jgi:hypothetical protein
MLVFHVCDHDFRKREIRLITQRSQVQILPPLRNFRLGCLGEPSLKAFELDSVITGRAITNAVAIVVLGPAFLATLRRAARRVHISPR